MQITDKDLIKDIKRYQCSDCIPELKNRHIGLAMNIYGRYSNILNSFNFKIDDFKDEIDYLIYTSARNFDLRRKKIKFSTYLAEQTKYFCLNKITELKKKKSIEAEPEDIIRLMDDCFKQSNSIKKNNIDMCDYLMSILEQFKDKRIIEIFKLRYFSGNKKMTYKEIGAILNCTNQTIKNIHDKAIIFLKNKLTNDKLFDNI